MPTAARTITHPRKRQKTHKIGHAARQAANGSLTHRIRLAGPDDELRRLADDFDDMLRRLHSSFEEQRRFIVNASHQLRTPQAVMKTMLQVAISDPDGRNMHTTLSRLEETNDRSIDILDSLLLLAQADRTAITHKCYDLVDVVEESPRARPTTNHHAVIRMHRRTGPLPVIGDERPLKQLVVNLVNLVDNAAAYNVPNDAWIDITLVADSQGHPELVIENPGELLDPAIISTFTEPFVRGAGRVQQKGVTTGTGLGLTIASTIARVHQADLILRARPDGGMLVSVRFPDTHTSKI
ncbi:two-component system sensor histidine kinase VanS [Nakamurella sp. UYEF19]|uniref:sensor histidine kinase n=1 Tax=Nakamurella sp. UYEF19 TaxID=1756392 RepID=UPI003391F83D